MVVGRAGDLFTLDEPRTGAKSLGHRVSGGTVLFRWSNYNQVMVLTRGSGERVVRLLCYLAEAINDFESGRAPSVKPHWDRQLKKAS